MMKWSCVIFLIFLHVNVSFAQDNYCYSNDNDKKQTRNYATKTPYEVVRSPIRPDIDVPKCTPVKFWMLARHSTTNPSAKTIDELKGLNEFREAIMNNFRRYDRDRERQLCSKDFELLEYWRFDRNLTSDHAKFLTVQGWNDLKYTSIEYQKWLLELMNSSYPMNNFRFGHTDTQRTEASFKAFVEGLFGYGSHRLFEVATKDAVSMLLRPYKLCPEFEKQEDKAKDADSEYTKFLNSSYYKKMAEEVSARLAFNYNLNSKQIDTMFDMCRYDQSWYLLDISPWCSVFTPDHINVLEYLEDLEYFYKVGYGSELSHKVMCAAVKDMVTTLQDDTYPKVTAYFSHAYAIQLFLTSLGFAKDREMLRADNYLQMKNRNFRSSVLSPFGSNLVVVKYDCPDDSEQHKVRFFLNERTIKFDWCNDGLCNLSKLVETFQNFTNSDCSETFCGGNSAGDAAEPVALVKMTLNRKKNPLILFQKFFQQNRE